MGGRLDFVFGTHAIIPIHPACSTEGSQRSLRLAREQARSIPIPLQPVSIKDSARLGDPRAPATIVMFSDFECPYCGTFASETLPQLIEALVTPGTAQVAFWSLPLPRLHANAEAAAAAAECARLQGQFWPYHDRLFDRPADLTSAGLSVAATKAGLEASAFESCMAGQVLEKVRAQTSVANRLGIRGTPSFFVGATLPDDRINVTVAISGAAPLARFLDEVARVVQRP